MTDRKLASNRANARRSTGPRTVEGLARSSMNGLRHGLLSGRALVPGEDPEELAALRAALFEDLAPVGALEELLADRVVSVAWRLRRVGEVDAGLARYRLGRVCSSSRASLRALDSRPDFAGGEEVLAGEAWVEDTNADGWGRLSRYEAGLDRALFRALHELERRQRARAGEPVPVPAVLEVEVVSDPASTVEG